MSYLDTIIETRDSIKASSDVPSNHKLLLIELIEKERMLTEAKEDSFYYFYSDVASRQDIFDFKTELKELYSTAQEHADCCIGISVSFSHLEANTTLHNWLSSAIRIVDCISLHYLQEVLEVECIKQGEAGPERSRYIQINKGEIKAEKAGRIMDNLYAERNKMEHKVKSDPNDPRKKILQLPKYKSIMKTIKKRFPEALVSFDDAYKEHYT
jgi:hypothetical protein